MKAKTMSTMAEAIEPVASTSQLAENSIQSSTEPKAVEAQEAAAEEPAPLTKSALKKKRKLEYRAELKVERKAREKAARKEKKADRRERIAAGEVVEPITKKQKRAPAEQVPWRSNVVLELAWDDKMWDKASFCKT